MKIFKTLLFFILLVSISCKTQQSHTQKSSPKITNYNKGPLEIKVTTFGLGHEITVGKINSDGTILFNWSKIEDSVLEDNEFLMSSLKNAIGMTFCNDKKITENTLKENVIDAKNLFLFKNGKQVGSLIAATDKNLEDNNGLNRRTSLVLGNSLSWLYSKEEGSFIANCMVHTKWEDSYDFKETTTYNIQLKKGWNIIKHTLLEKEDWKSKKEQGSLPKTIQISSVTKIPSSINWYVKYYGD